jgi:hypothetical protein
MGDTVGIGLGRGIGVASELATETDNCGPIEIDNAIVRSNVKRLFIFITPIRIIRLDCVYGRHRKALAR